MSAASPAPIEPQRSAHGRSAVALVYVGSLASVVLTLGDLPDPVASSFGADGVARSFVARGAHTALVVGLAATLPLLLLAAFSWLPRRFPQLANLPNREAWLAPERRTEWFARLDLAGAIVASATALFIAALHALLLDANAERPPRLAHGPFFALVLGFLATTLGTALWLRRSLRKPHRG